MVTYASPNALSAYRRLGVTGDMRGQVLAPLTRSLATDAYEGAGAAAVIEAALDGVSPERIEMDARGAILLVRALPLRPGGRREGALVLVRDVTDVRSRDRELSTKDATIREIHHRVKNNLQTVAALLRLQARRVDIPAARQALQESVRRVSSIAVVHETLALSIGEQVRFDDIVDRLLSMMAEVAAPESSVTLRRIGDFGELSAAIATPLAMALTELMQNAVEHAFVGSAHGEVIVRARRRAGRQLEISVSDDGSGLPDGFRLQDSERLGLQIVRTLVESELRGSIELERADPRGTVGRIVMPLAQAMTRSSAECGRGLQPPDAARPRRDGPHLRPAAGRAALARIAHVSEAHFIRTFRATFGETPHRYLQRRRIERSMFLLRDDRPVASPTSASTSASPASAPSAGRSATSSASRRRPTGNAGR